MHGRRRSPTEGTERRTSPGTQGKGRGMSETVGGNRAELGLEGMDQSRTEGKVQAWAKSVEERPKPRGQDFGGSTEVGEEIRSSTNQASDSDRHQEGDATGRAIGPGTRPRTQSIAERRRTEGGVGEKREEGNGEMRTYCTKAAVSGTSLYGSRPRPRVSARPEGEERRWLPEPDTGEGEGCGCIGTPGVTIAGTSLYGSRPHPQGAELWSAEHREAGRLLRRGYRKRVVARVRSTTKRGREGRTTGLLVVRRRRSNPQRAGGLRQAKPARPLTLTGVWNIDAFLWHRMVSVLLSLYHDRKICITMDRGLGASLRVSFSQVPIIHIPNEVNTAVVWILLLPMRSDGKEWNPDESLVNNLLTALDTVLLSLRLDIRHISESYSPIIPDLMLGTSVNILAQLTFGGCTLTFRLAQPYISPSYISPNNLRTNAHNAQPSTLVGESGGYGGISRLPTMSRVKIGTHLGCNEVEGIAFNQIQPVAASGSQV
ncbi:hypothetical protein DFH06DRAFT_1130052 [Mycena polygramma]|nr:hypothetical protein DFH06DRAFT_1130052 [Mycena polygramma]